MTKQIWLRSSFARLVYPRLGQPTHGAAQKVHSSALEMHKRQAVAQTRRTNLVDIERELDWHSGNPCDASFAVHALQHVVRTC